jgi:hypothetical protein
MIFINVKLKIRKKHLIFITNFVFLLSKFRKADMQIYGKKENKLS